MAHGHHARRHDLIPNAWSPIGDNGHHRMLTGIAEDGTPAIPKLKDNSVCTRLG
jgi:hypothetical protein